MLSFEELAILMALEPDCGMTKSDVVHNARETLRSPRFDERVALSVVDRLVGIDYVSRDRSGYLYLTQSGKEMIAFTKENSKVLISKLVCLQ